MADKRQSFRFRFPWSHSSRSKKESNPHSTQKTQNLSQSTSKVVPDDRPPFRPAGKAPVKKATPSQSQETQNADASASHAANESPKTLSPSRLSPSNKSHVITQPSTQSQPLEEAISSQPQDHRRKIEILSETDSSSEDSSSHNGMEISASADKSPDTLIQLSDSETESKEHEEARIEAHTPAAEDKTNGDTEPLQESINELHAAAAKDSIIQTNEAQSQAEQQHEKHEKVTEPHSALTDSGQHFKAEAALQAEQERVTASTDLEDHTKQDPLGAALQAEHERLTATTDLENHTKQDPLGAALQAEHRHKKHERLTEPHAASTDSENHTKDEAALKKRSSSSKVSIGKMVASSTAEQVVPPPPNKDTRDDISGVDKLAISSQMLDQAVGVVTPTGENKGAAMHLSSEPQNQEQPIRIRRNNYKLDQDDDDNEAKYITTNTDGDEQRRMTCINSNVQSVNNSILCNSSVTERSPGVTVCSFPPESIMNTDKESETSTHRANKAQVVQTDAERLTHESTVRRRCLRGLLMESSDSEPDNPNKPRRHGCRYACGKQTKKETEVGIV